jgi:ABC-type dipeptide/oligopeptide/nickel transport system permease subunit
MTALATAMSAMMIAVTINAVLVVDGVTLGNVDGVTLGNADVIICVPSNMMVLLVVYANVDV